MATSDDRPTDFLAGGGGAATLIRAFDWAATSLGPLEAWPQSLKTATALILRSPVPMVMLWGPDGRMIYNDAYSVFAGGRHPEQLGKKVLDGWPEVADFNANVMKVGLAGGTLTYKDQELTLYRNGPPEQVFMDLNYSPVPDESGRPAGVIAVVIETTDRVLADRSAAAEQTKYRQALQQMPGFVGILSGPDYVYEYVNDAYVEISERTGFIGNTFRGMFPELEGQGFFELLDAVYSTGEQRVMRSMELRLHGREEPQFIDFLFEPIRDDKGEVCGIFIGGYELTEAHRAAAALLASEEQLRLATENAEVGLWDVDVVNDVLFWPARVKAMFGISADVPVSMADFYAGVHPDDLEHTAVSYAAAADPSVRALYDVEYRTVGKEDGVIRWVGAKGRGQFDAAGACLRMIGTARDITDRKAVEQALRDLNESLERQVVERSRERAVTWQVTPDLLGICNHAGFFERSNPAWKTLLGWTEAEVASTPIFELMHPDDVERTTIAFETLKRGESVIRFENRYRRKAGGHIWLSWVAAPEGALIYCTGRDVTAERAQAEALEARIRERDLLWRNAQDLLVVVDRNGVFQDVSSAATKILGWEPREMVGRPAFDFVHPDDMGVAQTGLDQATVGELQPSDQRYRHKDGGWRWLSWVAAPDGELIYGSARHVTLEREQAQALASTNEALRQSQKMEAVGQLTGGIAHDFNNLLAGISGSLELLETRLNQGRLGDATRYIDAAQTSAKRAAALTQRLLAFSRRQTLDPKPTDVGRLIAGMDELIRRTVGPAIDMEVKAAPDLWLTCIDPPQLENALLNLSINARDAMPAGGRLVIAATNERLDEAEARVRDMAPGDYVALCVTDTGAGMTPEVVARAFDPFFTTKPLGQGTGLGLSMIHGFVRQSGGQVRIDSEVGEGATICLHLPRFVGELDAATASAPDPDAASGDGETVVIIDDEPIVRMLMVEILTEAGFRTIEADDGPAGLAILRSGARVDLLITDVGLPGGMNGRQVADAARTFRPGLKVLFVTGYADTAAVSGGDLDPGMQVITKPFSMNELGAQVREMISAPACS